MDSFPLFILSLYRILIIIILTHIFNNTISVPCVQFLCINKYSQLLNKFSRERIVLLKQATLTNKLKIVLAIRFLYSELNSLIREESLKYTCPPIIMQRQLNKSAVIEVNYKQHRKLFKYFIRNFISVYSGKLMNWKCLHLLKYYDSNRILDKYLVKMKNQYNDNNIIKLTFFNRET